MKLFEFRKQLCEFASSLIPPDLREFIYIPASGRASSLYMMNRDNPASKQILGEMKQESATFVISRKETLGGVETLLSYTTKNNVDEDLTSTIPDVSAFLELEKNRVRHNVQIALSDSGSRIYQFIEIGRRLGLITTHQESFDKQYLNRPNEFHDSILSFLLDYKKNNPNFTFWLREKNKNNRLNQGFWFQGREDYASVGLFNAPAGNMATRSVSLVFFPSDKSDASLRFELIFKNENHPGRLKFYSELINILQSDFGEKFIKDSEVYYFINISERSAFNYAAKFLEKYYTRFAELAEKVGVPEILINGRDFENKLNNTLKVRDRILAGDPTLTPMQDETLEEEEDEPADTVISNALKRTILNNDSVLSSDDLLEFTKDVRALASIMAMKEIKPPLAIALFGPWGSGKSFFMYNLRITIDCLSKYQSFSTTSSIRGQNESVFCEGIVQIEFNAWSYLDANLWAGLVANIFEKLDDYIKENVSGNKEKEEVQKKLSEKLQIVSEQRKQILNEKTELTTRQGLLNGQIRAAEYEKTRLLAEIKRTSLKDIRKAAIDDVGHIGVELKAKLESFGITRETIQKLSPNALYAEVKSWVTFVKNFIDFSTVDKLILGASLVILAILLFDPAGWIKEQLELMARGALIFLTFIAPYIFRLYKTFKKFQDIFAPIQAFKNKFNERVEEAEHSHQNKLSILGAELTQNDLRINDLNNSLTEINSQIAEVEYAMKHSITRQAFFNFISKRHEGDSYSRHLGIISTVRRDFETLSSLFKDVSELDINTEARKFRGQFDKPLDRIILYIDDLDRCSDAKVIEVLEAVHLLMAYPLFVVVVGVDKRCVHNALLHRNLKEYSGLQFEGFVKSGISEIKPAEYLEKIFQIPFHIDSATENHMIAMIDALVGKEVMLEEKVSQHSLSHVVPESHLTPAFDSYPSGIEVGSHSEIIISTHVNTDDLKLKPMEFDYLKEVTWLVGNSPRTIKRFINMYRIIRTHELLSYKATEQDETFLTIIFILAFSLGKFRNGATAFYEQCSKAPGEPLRSILKDFMDRDLIPMIESKNKLRHILDVKGEKFNHHIPFVKRFSFG